VPTTGRANVTRLIGLLFTCSANAFLSAS
jgi:hypothetical protein